MAVPQPLLNQRPILEPSKIKIANAFTREDVVSTKTLLDFAHLYNFFKNNFEKAKLRFSILKISIYMCVLLLF